MPGSRGWGRTPVSMTATITPAPVENLWACSICSAVNGGGVLARSEFGSTPPTTQAPFLRMGPSGPGGPSGGAAATSGLGGVTAPAVPSGATATNEVTAVRTAAVRAASSMGRTVIAGSGRS